MKKQKRKKIIIIINKKERINIMTTIENKRRELIENVENTISKIQKTKTVFDVDFLEDCKNKEDFENLHIIFDDNG